MFFTKVRKLNFFTSGLKIYSNQIPLRFDSFSGCSNACSYCYQMQVQKGAVERMGKKYNPQLLKIGDTNRLYNLCSQIFDDKQIDVHSFQQYWLLHHGLIENGTMGDPFMSEEPVFMNTYNLMNLAKIYKLPLYFNTKGNALINSPIHFDRLCSLKQTGVLVDLTLPSINNNLLKKFEPKAPLASQRLKLIEDLTDNGVDVVASARPILKGVTDVNYKKYIEELCRAGVSSIHLRTLIISGKQLAVPFWKQYAKDKGMVFKNISYRYPLSYFMDLFNKAQEVAEDYNVTITGSHTLFFKFGTANKCDYSKVSKAVQHGLYHPGMVDILRNVYKHKDEPQLLTYETTLEPKLHKAKDFLEQKFKMDAYTTQLIWSSSCTMKVRRAYLLSGEDIIKNGIWNGTSAGFCNTGKARMIRAGYISSINGIYLVVDKNNNPVVDDNNNLTYAYIPEEIKNLGVTSTHHHKVDLITTHELTKLGLW